MKFQILNSHKLCRCSFNIMKQTCHDDDDDKSLMKKQLFD